MLYLSARLKKFRLAMKIVIVLCLLLMLSYLFNYTLAASADAPIVITNSESDTESDDGHYPGEPVRVYNSLEEYWQDKLAGVAD